MRYTSFVLRFWQPGDDDHGSESVWHGRIEHVQSGRVVNVNSLEAVIEFLSKHIAAQPASSPDRLQKNEDP